MDKYRDCGNCEVPVMPETFELACAYVPYQQYNIIYSPEESLEKGTVFPELANIRIYSI